MKTGIPLLSRWPPVKGPFLTLFFSLLIAPVHAQIQPAWVQRYNNNLPSGQHQALKMLLDRSGNIYLCGFSANTNGGTGYATLKIAPNGQQLWAARFDSTNSPSAQPMSFALDSSNNVSVTGNAITLKYDPSGNLLWIVPYNAAGIAADPDNNVCITGVNSNYVTMKFSPEGSNLWMETFISDGPCNSQTINIDSSGNVYVCGSEVYISYDPVYEGPASRPCAIKYRPNGDLLWRVGDFDAYQKFFLINATALDAEGDLYFLFTAKGGVPIGFTTYAYAPTDSPLWAAYNPTSSIASQSRGLVLDRQGNVLITGSDGYFYPYSSYITLKINAAGDYVWTNTYPTYPQSIGVANSIATDRSDNCYITGYSPDTRGTNDIVTIAYDTNGRQLWLQRYTGLGYGAVGNAIAADNSGNIYVAGYENVPGGGSEMVLIKYSPVTLHRQSNGNFLLQAQGSPGQPFDIQASTNLQSWLDLGSQSADTNGLLQFLDTNASMHPWRFYLAIPK